MQFAYHDFHYFSSDDDLSDFTDHQATLRHLPPPYPQDGTKARQSKKATDRSPKGNSERGGGEVKSTPKNRRPLFTDSVDEPVKRPDGLRSSRYTEGNLDAMFDHAPNGFRDNEKEESNTRNKRGDRSNGKGHERADGNHNKRNPPLLQQNGHLSSPSSLLSPNESSDELLEKNRQLEQRVADLEEEVGRLNAEVDHLKGVIASKELETRDNAGEAGGGNTGKDKGHHNHLNERNAKNGDDSQHASPRSRGTKPRSATLGSSGGGAGGGGGGGGSFRSTPDDDKDDLPDVFKRLSSPMHRGRSVDSLNNTVGAGGTGAGHSSKDRQLELETLRSESIRTQTGRKYVKVAQQQQSSKAVHNNSNLVSQMQQSKSTQNISLSRASSNKSLDNLGLTNNMIRGSIRRKLIGKRDPLAESAAMRWKTSPRFYTKPPRERLFKRWRGAKGENLARLYLRGRSINLQGPNEFIKGRIHQIGELPEEELSVEWVFGYRGKDCRNNLHVVSTGEVCYFTAAIAVLYNTTELTQRHYVEHSAEIKSMALHPDKITLATGQGMGIMDNSLMDNYLPHIRVWNSINLETLAVIGEDLFTKSINNVCFSKMDGGYHLCAIDESAEHLITIWDWKQDPIIPLAQQHTYLESVVALEYHPSANMVVTCSKENLTFWNIEEQTSEHNSRRNPSDSYDDGVKLMNQEGSTFHKLRLFKRSATFDLVEKPKQVTSVVFLPDSSLVSGDSNGNLIMWDLYSCRILRVCKAALDGPVSSIVYNTLTDTLFIGGVHSPLLLQMDPNTFTRVSSNNGIVDVVGGIRTMAFDPAGNIYIGTTKNCILTSEKDHTNFTFASMGHSRELWGLCVDGEREKFLTCGSDRLLIYWNKRQAEWYKEVDYGCVSAAFHPIYSLLAVGTDAGRWFALNTSTRDIITMHADSKDQFNCMTFSPNGKRLAIGAQDSGIYIYRLDEQDNGAIRFSKMGKCIGHTSYVTHLDWSVDSQVLRSNSGNHELLYWSVNYCKQLVNSDVTANTEWASSTCTLDFTTIGIWPEGYEGSEINSTDVSCDQNLVATGDDSHLVKIFNYPSFLPKAQFRCGFGHGSHVSRVRFLPPDGKNLVSTGGIDSSIILWSTSASTS
ncbi:echinoderm microtubule-associated protein-like 2 isoform X2 [Convolutriloba macropyga]|uniref:echinoderm microtubule-associated protein-like 2 isoform X2 n=1 Tax=Convolutriloba macropyga TaxID=536237 RepID=UPI003F51B102